MSFMDWIRGLTGRSEKKENVDTQTLAINTPEYGLHMGSDISTENANDQAKTPIQDTLSVPVKIDKTQYDPQDVMSTFKFACKIFGDQICEDPDRLKNIMADLAPALRSECKLLILLCRHGNIHKVLQSSSWEEADLLLWHEKTVRYLVQEEFIDELAARQFSEKMLVALSGKNIVDRKRIEEERRRKQEEENGQLRKQEKGKKIKQENLKAQLDQEEQEKRTKETLDELRRKLAIEEKARKDAEAKARVHEKEKKEAEALLEEERKRREFEKRLETFAKAITAENSASSRPDPTTAKGLFEKYKNSGEKVIIVADGWHGDFCFVVDQIVRDGGKYKAKGTCFRNGKFYKNYTYPVV